MSERNYGLGPNTDESLTSSAETEEQKSKKEKEKEQKRKQRQKKREETARGEDESSRSHHSGERDTAKHRRPAFLKSYLGVEKVPEDMADKKKSKKEKEADNKTSTESSEHATKDNPEEAPKLVEKLDEAETLEATEAYIAARSRQLDADTQQREAARSDGAISEARAESDNDHDTSANQANLRFLTSLRRKLRLSRTPPNEAMLEATLQEATSHQEAAADETQEAEEDKEDATTVDETHPQSIVASEQAPADSVDSATHPPSGELRDDSVVHVSSIASTEAAEPPSGTSSGESFQSAVSSSEQSPRMQTAAPSATVERGPQRSRAGDFLLGGFVGYLLGKRRGRIKTEKQLEPVRASLEREVSQLEQTIRRYEDRARSSVREQNRATSAAESRVSPEETPIQGSAETTENVPSNEEKSREASPESDTPPTHVEGAADATSNLAERVREQSEPTARVQEKTAEHLTGMGVAREAISYESGVVESKESQTDPSLTPERIDTMPTSSLLRHVEAIRYNQTNVRSLYERGELPDRVLRGALKEHLRGNSVENYLDKELRKRQESPEIYNPESVSSASTSKREGMLPPPISHKNPADNQLLTRHPDSSAPVSSSAPTTDESDSHQAQRLQSQRMKQASLGAVIGLILVIVLWLLLGGARLI